MMRAQKFAHLYPFDSSDSTNVARNHSRQLKKSGHTVADTAARVDGKIQKSAGPATRHQIERPLDDHIRVARWDAERNITIATQILIEKGVLPIEAIRNRPGYETFGLPAQGELFAA